MGLWALAKARVCVIVGQCCSQVNLIAVANMFTPSLLLGFVIALLTGLLFHLIVGGGVLALDLVLCDEFGWVWAWAIDRRCI